MSLNSKWLIAMEQLQAKHNKAFRKRIKVAKKTLFGKFEAVTINNSFTKPSVSGKAIMGGIKGKRVGHMVGAVGSEVREVYKNGNY
jgi:hypothetical protein